MPPKRIVTTKRAPAPKGPYSQGVIARDLVFVAGQGPVDPQTGKFRLGDIRSECHVTLKNIEAILKASGAQLADVVCCTVYLRDLADFPAMNEVYARFFPNACPARTTIQAGDLLHNMKVEIDAIAVRSRYCRTGRTQPRDRRRRKRQGAR